jgi:integrase/recombinase XerD
MVVRIFARHVRAFDPATEVLPADALPCHYRRVTPYLYSPAQIDALMRAAGTLTPPLPGATYTTLIGLLATTGCGSVKPAAWTATTSTWPPR